MQEQEISMENAKDWHVCGLIVQVKPEKIEQIQAALLAIPHTEIPAADHEIGKLVVVMQSHHHRLLLDHMENIRHIEGVIDVSLVYHEQDEQFTQN